MKQLLIEAPSHTPIFDFQTYNMETGQRIVRTAGQMLDRIENRIARVQDEVARAAAA